MSVERDGAAAGLSPHGLSGLSPASWSGLAPAGLSGLAPSGLSGLSPSGLSPRQRPVRDVGGFHRTPRPASGNAPVTDPSQPVNAFATVAARLICYQHDSTTPAHTKNIHTLTLRLRIFCSPLSFAGEGPARRRQAKHARRRQAKPARRRQAQNSLRGGNEADAARNACCGSLTLPCVGWPEPELPEQERSQPLPMWARLAAHGAGRFARQRQTWLHIAHDDGHHAARRL
jgi:hypothetical protein